jgi:hypothetical protein
MRKDDHPRRSARKNDADAVERRSVAGPRSAVSTIRVPMRDGYYDRRMSDDGGTWYELQPDGRQAGDAERYRDKAEAEQAALQMLTRHADVQVVDIAEYEIRAGVRATASVVSRIAAAQPPAPSEAEVDGLHLLPRGDPEC